MAKDPICGMTVDEATALIEQYIDKNGQDIPEIRNWKWGVAP